MKFVHQQLLVAGVGLSVCFLSAFGSVDQLAQRWSEYSPVLGNFFGIGILIVFVPIARWLVCLVTLASLQDPLAQSRGYSAQSVFVGSDYSKFNHWFLHVDEFGFDLDLKQKLQSKNAQ